MNKSDKSKTKNLQGFLKTAALALTPLIVLSAASSAVSPKSVQTVSSPGSSGAEVKAIQQFLTDWGLYSSGITGYYGEKTAAAVKKFQKIKGLSQTGNADKQTLNAMGISVGTVPSATQANIDLLARIISAEARGEPYEGQVAVGAVILNRIEHPNFPDSLSGVIFQNGAFTAVTDGQFNEAVSSSAYDAARDALNGWDPTNGCIYYYNPKKTSNKYMHSKPTALVIGSHRFTY